MIKIYNVVLPSVEQWGAVIRGMRSPLNSWKKSDSDWNSLDIDDENRIVKWDNEGNFYAIGDNDFDLMKRLCAAGTDHRKFLRMIPVHVDITAPLYWWKEFDTYKVGTVANSCSTMHKIADKEFTFDDFSVEQLLGREDDPFTVSVSSDGTKLSPLGLMADIVSMLNGCREKYLETKSKKYWWQMIQLLPSSYNQRRTVMLNYEVLANIYKSRKNHKLDCWRDFCAWIKTLPYQELITGEENE